MTEPRKLIEQVEAAAALPTGPLEGFRGYGVMGLPFQSGHVLALRRFPATTVGPGYTSVWHRKPSGEWFFYADVPPRQSCSRFFGAASSAAIETDIHITWPGPSRLHVTIPAVSFEWDVETRSTVASRLMSASGRMLPAAAWKSPTVLAAMSMVAGRLLGVGRVGLQGRVPNGQRFIANPRLLWVVSASHAELAGEDFGLPGPVQPQAQLEDFWIPQRGILAIGEAYFDVFDATRHSAATARA